MLVRLAAVKLVKVVAVSGLQILLARSSGLFLPELNQGTM